MINNREGFKKFLDENEIPQFHQKGNYSKSSKSTYLNKLTNFPEFSHDVFSINNPEEIQKIIDDITTDVLKQDSRSNRTTALKIYKIFLEKKNIYTSLKDDINYIEKQDISETEKKRLINSRLGQGKYREELKKLWNGKCSVTGFNDVDICIASHIKPWRDSTNEQKLDKFNGLFLIPTLDKLFDRGYISFSDDGSILISSDIEEESYDKLNIYRNMKIDTFDENKKYLEYHRKKVFRK
jgi:predicted restriction endonuclease